MRRAMLGAAVLTVCAAGCVSEVPTGDMRASWTIGLDEPSLSSCEAAGIDAIQVDLTSEKHDVSEVTSCPSGQRTFRQLPVTRYTVTLMGLDETGCPVYEGSVGGVTPADEGLPEEVPVVLERLPASGTVSVTWRFEDGLMCGAHGVEDVTVTILSDDVEQARVDVGCDEGQYEMLAVPVGSVDVSIEATSPDGALCHVRTNLDLAPCGTVDVLAVLEPCD